MSLIADAPRPTRSIAPFPALAATHSLGELTVREIKLDEVALRINYFVDADSDYLRFMGIKPDLLPTRSAWLQQYVDDYALPRSERRLFGMVLELDGRPVGFSNVGLLDDEASALVHFHIIDPQLRGVGLGTHYLRLVTHAYFAGFSFDHLYFEPNAFNTPSNRMAQKAGYRYLFTHLTAPGPIHLIDQPMTRWRISRADSNLS